MTARARKSNKTAARKARAARLRRQIKRLAKQAPITTIAETPAAFVRRRMAELAQTQKNKPGKQQDSSGSRKHHH